VSKARFPFKRNRLRLRLRKRKPQETQAFALASSQSWLRLLRPSIPIGWRLRLLRENFTQQTYFAGVTTPEQTQNVGNIVNFSLVMNCSVVY